MKDLEQYIPHLNKLVRQAGQELMRIYRKDGDVFYKGQIE